MARVALTDDNGALYGAPANWLNGRFPTKSGVGTHTLQHLASSGAHKAVNKSRIIGWGSSTMEGLNGALSSTTSSLGATYVNGAKGGERSEHILARMGARPAELVFPNDEIPASGSVTVTSPNLPASPNMRAFTGTVWGVEGTLSSTSTTLTWTRAEDGEAFAIPAGPAVFAPTLGAEHRNSFALLNVGKNNITGWMSDAEAIIEAQRTAMAHLSGSGERFLVIGHFVNTDYTPGQGAQRTVFALNDAAERDAGDYFFDLQGYVTGVWGDIWADAGVTPTQADLDQQAAGVKPSSLSADSAHLNSAALWAVARQITQKLIDLGTYVEAPLPPVVDTFTRPNATTLGSTEQGDKTWDIENLSSGGSASIIDGTMGFTGTTTARAAATVNGGASDGVLSYTVTAAPADSWNYFRQVDYNNYLMLRPLSGNWALWKSVGGSRTQIGSSTTPAAAGDAVEITLAGDSVTVRINGAVVMDVVESSSSSGTRYGFGVWNANAARWDDFRFEPAFAPQFTPAPDVDPDPVYLVAEDGTRYRLSVTNEGALTAVEA